MDVVALKRPLTGTQPFTIPNAAYWRLDQVSTQPLLGPLVEGGSSC
jgi:hypothetical protein